MAIRLGICDRCDVCSSCVRLRCPFGRSEGVVVDSWRLLISDCSKAIAFYVYQRRISVFDFPFQPVGVLSREHSFSKASNRAEASNRVVV